MTSQNEQVVPGAFLCAFPCVTFATFYVFLTYQRVPEHVVHGSELTAMRTSCNDRAIRVRSVGLYIWVSQHEGHINSAPAVEDAAAAAAQAAVPVQAAVRVLSELAVWPAAHLLTALAGLLATCSWPLHC